MDYTVKPTSGLLKLNETDPVVAALQAVAVLLGTRQGEVPLFREFGLAQRFLDKPLNVARPLLLLEVKEAIEKFVPQVELLAVDLVVDEAGASRGRVQPVVRIRIKGGD